MPSRWSLEGNNFLITAVFKRWLPKTHKHVLRLQCFLNNDIDIIESCSCFCAWRWPAFLHLEQAIVVGCIPLSCYPKVTGGSNQKCGGWAPAVHLVVGCQTTGPKNGNFTKRNCEVENNRQQSIKYILQISIVSSWLLNNEQKCTHSLCILCASAADLQALV